MTEGKTCSACGAANVAEAEICWLCQRTLDNASSETVPSEASASELPYKPFISQPAQPTALSYSLSTLMLAMTFIAVLCGMIAIAPGLGVVLAIASLPVLVRTAGVVKKRETGGLPTPPAKRILLFVSSLVATLVTVTVVCIASIGTFCGLCLTIGSVADFSEGAVALAFLISIPAAIAVTVGLIILSRKWAKARWRRDTQEP